LQIEAFSGQLSDVHLRILRSIGSGDYEGAESLKNEYLNLQAKINVTRGAVSQSSVQVRIAELRFQVLQLEEQLSGALQYLTVPESGYFVSSADGYESILTFDSSDEITKEQIEEVIANPMLPVAENVAGKVIDDYRWRMAAIIETDKVRAISQGSTISLRIGAFPRAVPAIVISASAQDDGTTVFVFECELLNEEFVKKRVASVRLLLGDYSGIRIPQSAIMFNDSNERGVYVRNGSVLEFRRVNMLRSEADFVIVENTTEDGFLQLYDEIVVKGTDLYDGKVVG
jgi:putative membrane fusion protein